MPVRVVARIVDEHDTRIWRALAHYVDEARRELVMSQVSQVGVDETSSKPGHRYVTLFADMHKAQVLLVTEGKDQKTFAEFAQDLKQHGARGLDREQRNLE